MDFECTVSGVLRVIGWGAILLYVLGVTLFGLYAAGHKTKAVVVEHKRRNAFDKREAYREEIGYYPFLGELFERFREYHREKGDKHADYLSFELKPEGEVTVERMLLIPLPEVPRYVASASKIEKYCAEIRLERGV